MTAVLGDLTEFAVDVLDQMDTPAFPADAVLGLLCPALDAPVAVYQRTQWLTGATDLVGRGCAPADIAVMVRTSEVRRADHPLMVAAAHGDLTPATGLRATGGAAAWHRSPVRAFLVDLGGWDQMASVGLRGSSTEICGLAFARSGPDFTDADLELLTWAQPVLRALERHAARLERWRAELGAPPETAAGRLRAAGLTTRELSVLLLLSQGHTATAMARRLGCSPRTVEKHSGALYRKLGARDRLTAVLEAQRRGLLPAAPPGGPPGDGTSHVRGGRHRLRDGG